MVAYLAQHVQPPLHETLGLAAPLALEMQWTAQSLCEAFAAKHSWHTRQGGRLDTYRAANWILRSALGGRSGVVLAFLPPPEQAEIDHIS